jgi:hypothetical protein
MAATMCLTFGLIVGCARLSAGGPGLPSDCIISRTIQDYERLDDQNLIIYGPGSRAYHVVLTTPSNNIDSEFSIGVLDATMGDWIPDGRICPYGGDAIIIDGPIVETIPIRSIESLDAGTLENLQVEFGAIESAGDLVTGTVIQ